MQTISCKDYRQLSQKAAELVKKQIEGNPETVLGLPTGSTPLGMYEQLAQSGLDFSRVTTFNLDEYVGLDKENPQSYYYYMNTNLYSKVNLKPENCNIPNGSGSDLEKSAERYDEKIKACGGIDLMVLGIGNNGHIGFNEPDDDLETGTHIVTLTEETRQANSRFFSSMDEVPKQAVTMGVGSIMKAKRILMLASGEDKKNVVSQLMEGKVTTENPATLLLLHPRVTVLCDWEEV